MNLMEIGWQVASLCNAGQDETVMERFSAPDLVSIEGQDSTEMPARIQGVATDQKKWTWWYENNEVHAARAHTGLPAIRPP